MKEETQGNTESKTKKIFTLCIVYKHPKVLLGLKKKGLGLGKWDGFGGKVEDGESIEDAAKRELEEETGLIAKDLYKAGEFSVELKSKGHTCDIHVFKVSDFSGEEKESEEMKPEWFFVDEIPFKGMWPDAVYWMPLFFAGRNFKGQFILKDENTLLDRKIEII